MDIDRWRSRLPVRRMSDGELIGWTVGYDPIVDVVNPVGHLLAEGVDVSEASEILERRGLQSLSEDYWALAPLPLTSGLDLRRPSGGWQWRRMVMTQLDDTRVWVRAGYPAYAERVVEVPIALPADDVLSAVARHPAE